jgi:hypothetical protein
MIYFINVYICVWVSYICIYISIFIYLYIYLFKLFIYKYIYIHLYIYIYIINNHVYELITLEVLLPRSRPWLVVADHRSIGLCRQVSGNRDQCIYISWATGSRKQKAASLCVIKSGGNGASGQSGTRLFTPTWQNGDLSVEPKRRVFWENMAWEAPWVSWGP